MPLSTFILGTWVPKMEWVSETARIWIWATGCGMFLASIVGAVLLANHVTVKRLAIIAGIFIVMSILAGLIISAQQKHYANVTELRTASQVLQSDITVFVANRALGEPRATDSAFSSPDIWFQKSSDYRAMTDNLFTIQFRQRLSSVVYALRQADIISDEEVRTINFWDSTSYPQIDRILPMLEEFNSRFK